MGRTTSESYKAKPSAKNEIEFVKKNAPNDDWYERKETKGGQFRFNLKAINRQVIGTSESYKTEKARENGVVSVKKNAPAAKVEDLTV